MLNLYAINLLKLILAAIRVKSFKNFALFFLELFDGEYIKIMRVRRNSAVTVYIATGVRLAGCKCITRKGKDIGDERETKRKKTKRDGNG
jgi:hypothetical protein